jgi:hypothetical protein
MKVCLGKLSTIFLGPVLLGGWVAGGINYTSIIEDREQQIGASMRDINEVMEAHVAKLMALPGVVGVFIGALASGAPCIKVMVIKATPELEKRIPRNLEGHPVLIVETGEIKPLSEKSRSA